MNEYLDKLMECELFKKISKEHIDELLKKIDYQIKKCSKGQVIAVEGEECVNIGIVLKGSVEVQKIYQSGKVMTIDKLEVGNVFGEAIIFSNASKYPATIIVSRESILLFINKTDIISLCSMDSLVLHNFMSILSNKILMLNTKIKNMSYKTLRQKIAKIIFDEYKDKNNLIIDLSYSRKEMSEHLGVPRPSISRELVKMKEEGIIDFYRNSIKILDISLLENVFLE